VANHRQHVRKRIFDPVLPILGQNPHQLIKKVALLCFLLGEIRRRKVHNKSQTPDYGLFQMELLSACISITIFQVKVIANQIAGTVSR